MQDPPLLTFDPTSLASGKELFFMIYSTQQQVTFATGTHCSEWLFLSSENRHSGWLITNIAAKRFSPVPAAALFSELGNNRPATIYRTTWCVTKPEGQSGVSSGWVWIQRRTGSILKAIICPAPPKMVLLTAKNTFAHKYKRIWRKVFPELVFTIHLTSINIISTGLSQFW